MNTSLESTLLDEAGLNLYYIFNISDLPADITLQLQMLCGHLNDFRQLILIGHGGKTFWERLLKNNRDATSSQDPVDQLSIHRVNEWFSRCHPSNRHNIIYPNNTYSPNKLTVARPIGLQALGKLAGWHHTSPFMVGINNSWGSWFAYRAVVLADTHFATTKPIQSDSPCTDCNHKVCISSCPPNACSIDGFDMNKCVIYRQSDNSLCRKTCLARVSCPIQDRHRYSEDQINYHYTVSMKMINEYSP